MKGLQERMPLLSETPPLEARRGRGTAGIPLVAGLVAAALLVAGSLVVATEFSFGPVNIGDLSVSGPRTWTIFPGKATVILECGGYKLWRRRDPVVIDGS
jgi:hypothetical protein